MYRPYMYAYYMLYVYGQSLVLNAIPCVSMCDNNIYPIHTCLLYTICIWTIINIECYAMCFHICDNKDIPYTYIHINPSYM